MGYIAVFKNNETKMLFGSEPYMIDSINMFIDETKKNSNKKLELEKVYSEKIFQKNYARIRYLDKIGLWLIQKH
jgi:hypothetical protein